ncbi:hypothetical protein D9M68_19850 [compost metagenome]
MAIPDYCDDRAKKHFHRNFVGEKHGEDGTKYSVSWSSTSDARPTTVHHIDKNHCYCAFCGNRAFPIQNDAYMVTGHSCVCKDAMDELEWRDEYNLLLNDQAIARQQLKKKAPLPKKEALLSVVERKFNATRETLDRGFSILQETNALGIIVGHPFDTAKE